MYTQEQIKKAIIRKLYYSCKEWAIPPTKLSIDLEFAKRAAEHVMKYGKDISIVTKKILVIDDEKNTKDSEQQILPLKLSDLDSLNEIEICDVAKINEVIKNGDEFLHDNNYTPKFEVDQDMNKREILNRIALDNIEYVRARVNIYTMYRIDKNSKIETVMHDKHNKNEDQKNIFVTAMYEETNISQNESKNTKNYRIRPMPSEEKDIKIDEPEISVNNNCLSGISDVLACKVKNNKRIKKGKKSQNQSNQKRKISKEV